jgi:hypothetical protein
VPHLIVWGDFRDKVAVWQRVPIVPTTYRDAIVAAGGKADATRTRSRLIVRTKASAIYRSPRELSQLAEARD